MELLILITKGERMAWDNGCCGNVDERTIGFVTKLSERRSHDIYASVHIL